MADKPRNIAASVRQRLLNLARAEEQAFGVVLVAFGLERLIYRLSVSAHRDRFVLKGGMLVTLWTKDRGRFTRDIDFLSFGDEDEATLKKIIAEILAIDADDGLIFDDASLTVAPIREDQVYGGMRLKTTAFSRRRGSRSRSMSGSEMRSEIPTTRSTMAPCSTFPRHRCGPTPPKRLWRRSSRRSSRSVPSMAG